MSCSNTTTIASAAITVAAGSRIKIEGSISVREQDADCDAVLAITGMVNVGAVIYLGLADFGSLSFTHVTAPQAGGQVTVDMTISALGAGASLIGPVSPGMTTLVLTEIPAP